MKRLLLTALVCAVAAPLLAQDCPNVLGPQKADAASIEKVEDAWGDAYSHGGTAYLQCLLAPDYVSVSAKGVPRDRAVIIAAAQKNAAQNPAPGSKPSPKPAPPKIQLYGKTAVVQSTLEAAPDGKYPAMYSSDVFTFQDGAWIAIYSQHTAKANE